MRALFETANLGLNHVQVIVRGLYEVAQADQVHDTERVLIEEFYNACRQDVGGIADFADILKSRFSIDNARDILSTPALRRTFLRSCLLLAFADGKYSAAERNQIVAFAEALEVDAATLASLTDEVTEHLLAQIASVQNIDALCDVARELKS